MQPGVLIIDDDQSLLEAYTILLEEEFRVYTAATGAEGLVLLQRRDIHAILLDIRLPDADGIEVLRQVRTLDGHVRVLMVTALNDARLAVDALRYGASDYLVKPVDNADLCAALWRTVWPLCPSQETRAASAEAEGLLMQDLIGASPAMQQIAGTIRRVAPTTATVLITGETGVGKERLAHAVHHHSPRHARAFVAVNCAAIPASLAESTLLGHERGAFTGAVGRHLGAFEQAHTGTVFLDEVGSLPLLAQGVLLRVLQDQTFQRVGGESPVRVDVRVVAASNQDLRQQVAAGTFRADLWYRLHVVPIQAPPLRERSEDIPALVQHFLSTYNAMYARQVQGLTPPALAVLQQWAWPGNVRELEHVMARLVATTTQPQLDLEAIQWALDS